MKSSHAEKPDNFDYCKQVCEFLPNASYDYALAVYDQVLNDPSVTDWVLAQMGLHDRYFLLTILLNNQLAFHVAQPEWLYERCREVEANPDGYLDLWAREHWKSSLITFAGIIQECAKDSKIYPELEPDDAYFRGSGQEITIGILSYNNRIARGNFVNRIKRELETNQLLPQLYDDVFWKNPKREAPTWSRDDGLILKRKGNPAEPTIAGYGLVDALPTSLHFKLLVYDDVVTEKSVTPDMIIKTTESWELSRSVSGMIKGKEHRRTWYIGTRYNYADTYKVMLDRKVAIPRLYPATDTGTKDGRPVFLSEIDWDEKKRENSLYTLSCQYLQNPVAGKEMEFQPQWVRRYEIRPLNLNVCITVDPAHSRKKGSSNTAFAVIGMDIHRNKYFLDGACHKMNLSERWTMLKKLRNTWLKRKGIQVVRIGYERYGLQSDIEHFEEMMKIEKKSFPIDEVAWVRDGEQAKHDRIRRLLPDHQNWRFFYPYDGQPTKLQMEASSQGKDYLISRPIKRINEDGRLYDVVDYLLNNEQPFFPATTMLDLLDAMSRFYDMGMAPPIVYDEKDLIPEFAGQE